MSFIEEIGVILMGLKLKRFFAVIIACSVMTGMCAVPAIAADAEISVKCAVNNGIYSISGKGNDSCINVVIMPADDSVDELTAARLSQQDYIAFSMQNNASGFQKSFNLPQDFSDGEYKTVLWDGAKKLELYFMSGSEAYKNELLSKKIKNGMLNQAVERYGEQYGIDTEAYEALKTSVKSAVEEELGKTEITDFAAQYKASVLKASFDRLENTQEIYDVLVMLNTDFTYYNKLNESGRQTALLKLLKNLPDTPEQLKALAEQYSKELYQDTNKSPSGSSSSSVSSRGPAAGSPIITTDVKTSGTISQPLSDISGHWAENSIDELVGKGIVSGSDDGNFYPENNITRAEFSKMLAGAIGIGANTGLPQQFSDVDGAAWYYGYVMALCERGMMLGYDDGTFGPNNSITRQEMAAAIYRVLENRGILMNDETEFSDISEVSEYARAAVLKLGGANILSGFDGKFRPADNLTRAEAAAVMLRTYNALEAGIAGYAQAQEKNEAPKENDDESAQQQTLLVKTEMTKKEARTAEAERLIPKLLNRPIRGVTRAGFISDVYDLTNSGSVSAKEQYFSDLALSREETASIQAAADYGFIASEGEFRPDEVITGYEAIRVMVCALGYKEYAEAAGGWPSGYMKAADKAALLYGVSGVAAGALDEDAAKLMLLNMLEARVVTMGAVGGDEIKFVADENTLLEKAFGIYKSTGIVQETKLNSLERIGINEQRNVTVGGEKYIADEDDEDYLSYIGYHVNVYHTDDNELFMLAKTEKNKTVTFPADGAKMQDNLTVLYEEESGNKSSRYKLNGDYYFLYNGALSERTPKQIFSETEDGTVELLDNDSDGKYDIILIKRPEYVVVDSISKINKLIYDKNSSENVLDLFDDEIIFHVDGRNGQQIRFLDISAGETYEMYVTEDKKLVSLTLMSKALIGRAAGSEPGKITIDGTVYKTTEYFNKYYADILTLGSDCSFTLSSDGKIISFSESGGDMKLGYITFAGWEEGKEDESMLIRMFTQDNKFETYTADKKLKVDGRSTDVSDLYSKLSPEGAVNDQLVGYQIDDGGKIKALDFSELNSGNKLGENKKEWDSLTEYKFRETSFYYKDSVELMYPSFNVSGTIVFVIPNNIKDRDVFKVTDSSFFTDAKSYSNLKVYNLSENGTAGAVVVRSDNAIPSMSKYTASFVVEKVKTELNDDGEAMKRVYGWTDQKYRSYFIDDSVSIYKASGEKLGFGDVIRLYADGDIIKSMICDFDANENVFARNNDSAAAEINGGNKDFMYQLGKAYSVGNGFIYLGGGDTGEDMSVSAIRNFSANTANIAVIDMKEHTVRTGTLSDIRTYKNCGSGDIVLIRQRNLFTMAIYVYMQ